MNGKGIEIVDEMDKFGLRLLGISETKKEDKDKVMYYSEVDADETKP